MLVSGGYGSRVRRKMRKLLRALGVDMVQLDAR
jgi:hypothetical protein